MKIAIAILFILVAVALVTSGIALHRINHGSKVIEMVWHEHLVTLTNVIALKSSIDDLDSNADAVTAILALSKIHDTNAVESTFQPDTNNAIAVDPATGLPFEPKPQVLGITGRVTESNDQWWRWSFQFAIGNASAEDQTLDASVQFLDKDGFVLNSKSEYHLHIPAYATNRFSDYDLIDLPVAANVKKLNVVIGE